METALVETVQCNARNSCSFWFWGQKHCNFQVWTLPTISEGNWFPILRKDPAGNIWKSWSQPGLTSNNIIKCSQCPNSEWDEDLSQKAKYARADWLALIVHPTYCKRSKFQCCLIQLYPTNQWTQWMHRLRQIVIFNIT